MSNLGTEEKTKGTIAEAESPRSELFAGVVQNMYDTVAYSGELSCHPWSFFLLQLFVYVAAACFLSIFTEVLS